MDTRFSLVVALLLSLLSSPSALAQDYRTSVRGTVLAGDTALSGITVRFIQEDTGEVRSIKSGRDGD
ncbi:MAG TPA: hypothetical protein VFV34_27315, partial [Blastocatellia bacterium]|nr:hypothetical protein [Blastocatellia bacterium]